MPSTGDPQPVLRMIEEHGVKQVEFRFVDLAGRMRRTALDASAVDAERLRGGVLIDATALPGWREVTESDLLAQPDLGSAWLDPFAAQPTLALTCTIVEPGTLIGYERDPRAALLRALAMLGAARFADEVRLGAELGFWVFDEARFELGGGRVATSLRVAEAADGGEARAAHRSAQGTAHLAAAPVDQGGELRAEIVSVLAQLGITGVGHRHGRAPGQHILELPAAPLPAAADRLVTVRHVVHQVAASYGRLASFLAKPLAEERGAGLSLALSLWAGGKPVFAGNGYADLSPACLAFVGGIVAHARALAAFTNPTTNSWRRLRRDADEPTLLAYAAHNRSAALRIPYAQHPTGKRVELRFPDPTAHPYLAPAAILLAGLHGVAAKIDPGEPIDRNLYDLPAHDPADLASLPASLGEALDALAADTGFLTAGEALPSEAIDAYVRLKRAEIAEVEAVPHPAELRLYHGL